MARLLSLRFWILTGAISWICLICVLISQQP